MRKDLEQNTPFSRWKDENNVIHSMQWELTYLAIESFKSLDKKDAAWSAVRLMLDRAIHSDQYWWASASPWWDLTIVLRESQRIADVIRPLTSLPAADRGTVAQLVEKLTTEAAWWEKSGLAKRRQTGYLEETGAVHYMAGAQV
jgi:hypothetical protein